MMLNCIRNTCVDNSRRHSRVPAFGYHSGSTCHQLYISHRLEGSNKSVFCVNSLPSSCSTSCNSEFDLLHSQNTNFHPDPFQPKSWVGRDTILGFKLDSP